MALDDIKREMGKRPVAAVQLHLDRCPLTWGLTTGEGTCNASGDSTRKCYNSWATCQSVDDYIEGSYVVRFASEVIDNLQSEGDVPTIPSLVEIDYAPTILTPSDGLSVRSSIKIGLRDHPYSDAVTDPYLSDRDFNPAERGTFWPKLMWRQRYWTNRLIEVITGYLDDDGNLLAENYRKRTYIIESVSGPSEDGGVTITAKDPLRLADGVKAQWPKQTTDLTLDGDITDTDTQVFYESTEGNTPIDDWFNTEGQRYIRMGDEVMQVTAWSSVDQRFTVVRRTLPSAYAEYTFEVDGHTDGDLIQLCWYHEDERPDDIIYQLLTEGAGIPAAYIDTADWADVIDTWAASWLFTRLITTPTSVKQLLSEITNHLLMLWWDDRAAKIKLDILKSVPNSEVPPPLTEDENFVASSLAPSINESKRVTQVWVYCGQRNPVTDQDKASNYRVRRIAINQDRELDRENGQKARKLIVSTWLPADRFDLANEIATRYLEYYEDSKQMVSFMADTKDDDLWTGDLVDLDTSRVVDEYGDNRILRYLIIEADEIWDGNSLMVRYVCASLDSEKVARYGFIAPDDDPENPGNPFPDYENASDALRSEYMFISNNDGEMPNGDAGYLIL